MLIDSNIVIYASQPQYLVLRLFLDSVRRSISIVSYIEALGYHRLTADTADYITDSFQGSQILPLTNTIDQQAVTLRQHRRMGLGDAIIAATALTHNLALVTHNTDDFRWIGGLELLDPLTNNP